MSIALASRIAFIFSPRGLASVRAATSSGGAGALALSSLITLAIRSQSASSCLYAAASAAENLASSAHVLSMSRHIVIELPSRNGIVKTGSG
jgi:hypothetical protein